LSRAIPGDPFQRLRWTRIVEGNARVGPPVDSHARQIRLTSVMFPTSVTGFDFLFDGFVP